MKTEEKQYKYVEWLNAEAMHDDSQKWLLELEFIKDELLFFDDLIKSYTLQLIDSKHFAESKKFVDRLSKFHKKTDSLLKMVKTHEDGLEIMVDGVDQPKEEDSYKEKHRWLIDNINHFSHNYRTFKSQLFGLIKNIIKEQKQKRLLP